jgi:hypothetical protein
MASVMLFFHVRDVWACARFGTLVQYRGFFIVLILILYYSLPVIRFPLSLKIHLKCVLLLVVFPYYQVVTDMNGNQKTKKKLGGAYPGQRRPQHQQYVPPASDFGKDGQATAHFVAYGGGNALVLVKKDGSLQPESGGDKPQYIQGTGCACFLFEMRRLLLVALLLLLTRCVRTLCPS